MTLNVKSIIAAARALLKVRPKIGYSQPRRRTGYNAKLRKWVPGKDLDCSFSSAAINHMAGAPVDLRNPIWNVNIVDRLVKTGFYQRIKVGKHKTLKALVAVLRPGDTLRGPGHVVTVLSATEWLSWEHDGGGKPGWQKGEIAGVRKPYMRRRGWSDVARLIPAVDFKGRILAAKQKGTSYADALSKLLVRAPFDGPAWQRFLRLWDTWDKGMSLSYDPTTLQAPNAGHAFVVLGAGLPGSGKPSQQFINRLSLAAAAASKYPTSKIVVTGGKPRNGITEAAAGKAWLVANGVAATRIITEESSSSTIGNATGTLPILRTAKITTYTLISDASHLRRAAVLFAAAKLAIEEVENAPLDLSMVNVLAFNDYGPKPVLTASPVGAKTRAVVASEVATLLRITPQYQAAL